METADTGKGLPEKARPKRAPHRKVKSGCITCKIRRLRCDEQKPSCNRCVSTGRKCDGYAVSPTATGPQNKYLPLADAGAVGCGSPDSSSIRSSSQRYNAVLALPRVDAKELRSYDYFLHAAAPSFAGVFDAEFWMGEIPRACHADPAIWHAVVSLSAVHESYVSAKGNTSMAGKAGSLHNTFALQQFNTSIRQLLQPFSSTGTQWRALTASILYISICSLQGLYKQALSHLRSSRRLLKEVVEERDKTVYTKGRPVISTSQSTSVSFEPLRAIVTTLDTQARAFENGGLTQELDLIAENEACLTWRYYKAPLDDPKCPSKVATTDNLASAGRAFESLLGSMVFFSQQRASQIASVMTQGDMTALESLIKGQETFSRGFVELCTFLQQLDKAMKTSKLRAEQRRAIFILQLFQATTRLLFFRDPDHDPIKSFDIEAMFIRIVDIAEKILQEEGSSRAAVNGSYTPSPSTTSPLFLVAHSGFAKSTRLRAIELMRKYPRREGLWDSIFAADLAEHILRCEASANTSPAMAKIHDIKIHFEEDRHARVTLRNWEAWHSGLVGETVYLSW